MSWQNSCQQTCIKLSQDHHKSSVPTSYLTIKTIHVFHNIFFVIRILSLSRVCAFSTFRHPTTYLYVTLTKLMVNENQAFQYQSKASCFCFLNRTRMRVASATIEMCNSKCSRKQMMQYRVQLAFPDGSYQDPVLGYNLSNRKRYRYSGYKTFKF